MGGVTVVCVKGCGESGDDEALTGLLGGISRDEESPRARCQKAWPVITENTELNEGMTNQDKVMLTGSVRSGFRL